MSWRWLDLPAAENAAYRNMALDQALLESYIAGESPQTVRHYSWLERCVTIGRSQNREQARGSYPALNLYRRPTGGRAVVHGDDLTVTVIADEKRFRERCDQGGILASYHQILAGVIDTLKDCGVDAVSGLTRDAEGSPDCFATIGKCDVVDAADGEKIVGCAQLRARGAILQQMSIRPHERYHIRSNEFVTALRKNLSMRLSVDSWEQFCSALPSEYLRSSLLLGSEEKGADRGTKNSNL